MKKISAAGRNQSKGEDRRRPNFMKSIKTCIIHFIIYLQWIIFSITLFVREEDSLRHDLKESIGVRAKWKVTLKVGVTLKLLVHKLRKSA